jgi:abortive infection bacteriophage resistance protein
MEKKNLEKKDKINFKKEAKTFEEQLIILKNRGLIVENDEETLNLLSHINYYHLEGYWFSYYQKNEDKKRSHSFESGTTFNEILNIYNFDRKLRSLFTIALERIEISFRAQFIYYISHKQSRFPFSKEYFNFKKPYSNRSGKIIDDYAISIYKLKNSVYKCSENYLYEYKKRYKEEIPPLWIMGELMTFGELSIWYKKIRDEQTKTAISKIYNIDPKTLGSWMQHLSYIRNCCAHHSRLWNRICTITPSIAKDSILDGKFVVKNELNEFKNEKRMYNTILIIDYLFDIICLNPSLPWRFKVLELIKDFNIDEKRMGFPDSWEKDQFWEKSGYYKNQI